MSQKYTLNGLEDILTQIVHFAWDDYNDIGSPEGILPVDCQWTVAYQCACFLAQHTILGDDGVESEITLTGLKIGSPMSYEDRHKLAEILINEFNSP